MKLKIKDLHTGKAVYIAAPGVTPEKFTVTGCKHFFKAKTLNPRERHLSNWEKCVILHHEVFGDLNISERDLNAKISDMRLFDKEKQAKAWSALKHGPVSLLNLNKLTNLFNGDTIRYGKLERDGKTVWHNANRPQGVTTLLTRFKE